MMLGSMAVELLGLSIGGSVSSAAVATRFAVEEARMLRDRGRLIALGFDPDLIVGFLAWLR